MAVHPASHSKELQLQVFETEDWLGSCGQSGFETNSSFVQETVGCVRSFVCNSTARPTEICIERYTWIIATVLTSEGFMFLVSQSNIATRSIQKESLYHSLVAGPTGRFSAASVVQVQCRQNPSLHIFDGFTVTWEEGGGWPKPLIPTFVPWSWRKQLSFSALKYILLPCTCLH